MLRRRPSLLAVAAVGVAATLVACDEASSEADRVPQPVEVSWEAVTLPQPLGRPGRIAVRDAIVCDGTWYVVGGVFGENGESFPAGWTSGDGTSWTPMEFRAKGYWAKRAVLSSVACAGREVRMVGAKSGGAHGNPRVSTWYGQPDGRFTDVIAPFELYGGPQAVSVGRIAADPAGTGWLIAGNRTAGAAVWWSETGRDFRLVDDDPALARDAEIDTFAVEPVHDGSGWTVVGSVAIEGRVTRVPQAWTSADGMTWAREDVPPTEGFGSLDRVVRAGTGLVAAGLDTDAFGVWRRSDDGWESTARFGSLDPDGYAFSGVAGLATVGDEALVAVSDGAAYSLWTGPAGADDGWRPVATPTRPSTAGEHVLTVAADGDDVLLLGDDGESAGVWLASWPAGQ